MEVLRGGTHARPESAVPGWILETRELGHSCKVREIRLGPPLTGPPHLRFGLGPLRRWLIMTPGITCQRRIVVGTFYCMGNTGRATATRYIGTIACRESVSCSASRLSLLTASWANSSALKKGQARRVKKLTFSPPTRVARSGSLRF